MKIEKVLVLGAGTMGNGIVHTFAQSGYKVVMSDISEQALARGMETIKKNMERQLKKGIISQENMDSAISNITTSTDIAIAADAQLVIEAVTENKDLKFNIFENLDSIINPDAILEQFQSPKLQHVQKDLKK